MPPSRTAAEGRGHQLSEAGQRRTVIFGSILILTSVHSVSKWLWAAKKLDYCQCGPAATCSSGSRPLTYAGMTRFDMKRLTVLWKMPNLENAKLGSL